MPLLDALIYGLRDVFDDAEEQLPRRSRIRFVKSWPEAEAGDVIDDQLNDYIIVVLGSGSGGSRFNEIPFVTTKFETAESVYDRCGGRKIDMTNYPATIGALNRVVKFVADVQKTSGATNVQVRLYDVTHDALVSELTYATNTQFVEVESSALTVGSSSGNIRSDTPTLYEAAIRMNGGVLGVDSVYLTNARLVITYE